jgi:hypothetical protein
MRSAFEREATGVRPLREIVGQSVVVCYQEDVAELEQQLTGFGLNPLVQRAVYSETELAYSRVMRCFLGHRNAWRVAAGRDDYTLIVEADFVPCARLGDLPAFWPLDNGLAWGYLYQGSPRVLALVGPRQLIRGHCAPTVAYVVNRRVAEILLEFFVHETAQQDPAGYFTFESHMQWWAMGKGAEAYIPARHYGEHGGVANREHATLGAQSRGGNHRADNLAGRLAYLPGYANGSRLRYRRERLQARLLGWGRLLSGRWIVDTNVYRRGWRETVGMYRVGISRLLS